MHQVYQPLFHLNRLCVIDSYIWRVRMMRDCKMTQLLLELCWRSHRDKFELDPKAKNLQTVSMESSLFAFNVTFLSWNIRDANSTMTFSCYMQPFIQNPLVPELRVTWVSCIHFLFYCFCTFIINQVRFQCVRLRPFWLCCCCFVTDLPCTSFFVFFSKSINDTTDRLFCILH